MILAVMFTDSVCNSLIAGGYNKETCLSLEFASFSCLDIEKNKLMVNIQTT